jgi:hypothetical protein
MSSSYGRHRQPTAPALSNNPSDPKDELTFFVDRLPRNRLPDKRAGEIAGGDGLGL